MLGIYFELKVDFIRIPLAAIMQGMTKVGQETKEEVTVNTGQGPGIRVRVVEQN